MGIPTDPGYELYKEDNCHCWPVGQTPKKLYLSFSGIKCGSAWTPAYPPPPNGVYIVEYVASCTWQWTGPTFNFALAITATSTTISCSLPEREVFYGREELACVSKVQNWLAFTFFHYHSGWCSVSQREAV